MTSARYQTVELRIFARPSEGADYPIELRVPGDRDFQAGVLPGDLPEQLNISSGADAYGRALGEILFGHKAVGLAYREVQSAYRDRTVRIRLQVDPPELHPLRWESLYHPVAGGWLPVGATTSTLFSRYVPADYWGQPAPLYTRSLRILVLLSSPYDIEKYNLNPLNTAELEAWHVLFDGLPGVQVSYLQSGTAQAPTLHNLRAALDEGYHIVHFVTHGAKGRDETVLYLEKEDGSTCLTKAQPLIETFHVATQRPRLCFLAACESGAEAVRVDFAALGPALTAHAGIPAVVAMMDRVGIGAARALADKFYPQLLADGMVDSALHRARAELRAGFDWNVPMLFSRLPDNRLLGDPVYLLDIQRDILTRYGHIGNLERAAAGQDADRSEATAEIAYERARVRRRLEEYARLTESEELPPDLAEIAGKMYAPQRPAAPRIPADQLPPCHQGLIVLIGRGRPQEGHVWNPYQDVAWAAIQYHRGSEAEPVLAHCWLIATPGMDGSEPQAEVLAKLCLDRQITPHIEFVKPFEISDTYAQVQQIFTTSAAEVGLDATDIIADFTGGTKPMSAGMLLACARRWKLQYTEGRRPGLTSLPRMVRAPAE